MLNPMVQSDLVTYMGVTIVILFLQATIMLGKREGFQVQIQLFESLLKIAVRENTCIPFKHMG